MSHKTHTCEHCLMYDHMSGGCKEQASPNFGGQISPFTPSCQCYISTMAVYAKKTEQSDGARYAHWMICATPPQGFINSQITNIKNYE